MFMIKHEFQIFFEKIRKVGCVFPMFVDPIQYIGYTAPCGIQTKQPLRRRTPLYILNQYFIVKKFYKPGMY